MSRRGSVHDVASPLTSMLQSMELLFDDGMGPAMKAEGEKALRTGLATLEAKLRFTRFALGSPDRLDQRQSLRASAKRRISS